VGAISSIGEINSIDFSKDILLYSQTTMSYESYEALAAEIDRRVNQVGNNVKFLKFNTICSSVKNRVSNLDEYVRRFDAVLFVAGANSSNGRYLFSACQKANPRTYYISQIEEVTPEMLQGVQRLGITGATSTPKWLLQSVGKAALNVNGGAKS